MSSMSFVHVTHVAHVVHVTHVAHVIHVTHVTHVVHVIHVKAFPGALSGSQSHKQKWPGSQKKWHKKGATSHKQKKRQKQTATRVWGQHKVFTCMGSAHVIPTSKLSPMSCRRCMPMHAAAPYVACACVFRYHDDVAHVAQRVVRVHVYGVNPRYTYE